MKTTGKGTGEFWIWRSVNWSGRLDGYMVSETKGGCGARMCARDIHLIFGITNLNRDDPPVRIRVTGWEIVE